MALLERDDALTLLDGALAEAVSEAGGVVLVSGEAGIGKTVLVEAFAARHQNAVPVWWGACDALFTPRPLGPLHDMAAHVGGEVPGLLAAEAPRAQVFDAVLAALQPQPVIAVIEDVHWADEATLDLLRFVGRRIRRTRALLVLTYRDDELGPRHPLRGLLGDLAAAPGVRRLPLPPLSEDAVRALVGRRELDTAALHQRTGGNPFYITEVLANLEGGVPSTVREAVLARAARLSASGYAVLEAAAVIGQRVEAWLLAAVTGAEAQAVEECVAVGMLAAQGGELVFRHALARNVILEAISPLRRQVLHRLVLEALKALPQARAGVNRLVHHAEAAGDTEAVLAFAPAAAREADALGMHRAATALYSLLVRHAADQPIQQQIEWQAGLARAAQREPGRATTIAAYERAVELARQAGLALEEGRYLVRLAGTLNTVGRGSESGPLLSRALDMLEALDARRDLVDAYRTRAMRDLSQGDTASAVHYARLSHRLALESEHIPAILSASQILGLCLLPVDHQQGCEQLEQCLALALEHNQFWVAATVYPNLIMTYIDVYRLHRADELLQAALPFAVERDMDTAAHTLHAWQALLRLYQGRWTEAGAIAARLLEQPGLEPASRNPALAAVGRVRARRGDPDALAPLDEALEHSARVGNRQRMGVYYCARAEAAWLAGDRECTLREARAFYETAVRNRQPGFAAELAYWRWRAGDDVTPEPWMVQPFVLEMQGDWRGAAAAWEALGCPYERARALARGDTAAQAEALAIFESLGARPAADQLRQQLRAAGAVALPRRRRAATRENPFGLTTRQVEVLRLLVGHLSNAEIAARLHISPKTVDHHVSAILARLNVGSRHAAAEIARQHPAFQSSS